MFKKILMSGLILGALAATVGAGSYAAFTDSGTATGTTSAATVDLLLSPNGVNSYGENATVTFAPQNMLPGGSATTTFYVYNNGNANMQVVLDAGNPVITETNDDAGNGNCTSGSVSATVAGLPANLAPSTQAPVTVTFTLDSSAGNECQNNDWSVATTVVGTGY